MALDGGGGGGGPLGFANSFTGTAQALEITGNRIYGYSGVTAVDNNETNLIDYTTGNFVSVLRIQFNYTTDSGDNFTYFVRLADTIVQQFNVGQSVEGPYRQLSIIVPAYTNIKCSAANITGSTERNQVCGVTGRIYR